MAKLGVAERVRIEAGSFFDSVPAGGNAYVLKHVIHDWPVDEAVQILRNLRGATEANTTVLLVELVIPEHDRDFIGKWADLEMLLGANGRERTAAEYRAAWTLGLQDDAGGADRIAVQFGRGEAGLTAAADPHELGHAPMRVCVCLC